MTDSEILDAIERVCTWGGDVVVQATDPFNPQCGRDVRIRVVNNAGHEVHYTGSSGCYDPKTGRDVIATSREALVDALKKIVF
jgi:hypothetical protein